jgi:cytochrome P450
MFEMRVVAETILKRTRLVAASPRPERAIRRAIVLAPRRGTHVVLQERQAMQRVAV